MLKKFARRRIINISATLLTVFLFCGLVHVIEIIVFETAEFTGWTLLALMIVLVCYSLRKKIVGIPLGSVAALLQWHIYLGLISLVVFLEHLQWSMPNGAFEITLAFFFVLTSMTGVIGLFLSRSFPKRLSQRGEEIIFERIKAYINQLREESEKLVFESAALAASTSLTEHYVSDLGRFFQKPRNVLSHLMFSRRPLIKVLQGLESLERHLNEEEKIAVAQLRTLIEKKDDLDFHYALQGALKGWLFLHVPATAVLIALVVVHVSLACAFG
jgi:hypothetical protein